MYDAKHCFGRTAETANRTSYPNYMRLHDGYHLILRLRMSRFHNTTDERENETSAYLDTRKRSARGDEAPLSSDVTAASGARRAFRSRHEA